MGLKRKASLVTSRTYLTLAEDWRKEQGIKLFTEQILEWTP